MHKPLTLTKLYDEPDATEECALLRAEGVCPSCLAIDVHGFDGDRETIVGIKPTEDRSAPSEPSFRLEIVSGITRTELQCFVNRSMGPMFNAWESLEQTWLVWMPLAHLPEVPPVQEEMIPKVYLLFEQPSYGAPKSADKVEVCVAKPRVQSIYTGARARAPPYITTQK